MTPTPVAALLFKSMRLCFNIELPDHDLQRVGQSLFDNGKELVSVGHGIVGPDGRLVGSSRRGFPNRELSRFFPVLICLEALTQVNEWHLKRDRFAPLYQSGVYYQEEPPGEEEWLDIPSLYAQGFGDCEDIACALTGEYRHNGVAANPCISFKDFDIRGRRITLVHVLTLMPDDSVEDPSKVLGMKGSYNDHR